MKPNFLLACLVGGIINFLGGFLIFGNLLAGYISTHTGPDAVLKEPHDVLSIAWGCLAYGILIAVIYHRWAGIKTAKTGAEAGAIIGLISGLAYTFWEHAGTFSFDGYLSIFIISLAYAVLSALTGAGVGWMLGRRE